MPLNSIVIRADWDDEAGVWVATSDDVPGLVAEAATLDELDGKLDDLIPALIELNGVETGAAELPVFVMAQHMRKMRVAHAA